MLIRARPRGLLANKSSACRNLELERTAETTLRMELYSTRAGSMAEENLVEMNKLKVLHKRPELLPK